MHAFFLLTVASYVIHKGASAWEHLHGLKIKLWLCRYQAKVLRVEPISEQP